MDQVINRGQFAAARIRRAAGEAGIGPDDPLAPLIEALAALPEDCEGLFEGLSGNLRQLLTDAKRQASGEIATLAVAGVPTALDRLAAQRLRGYWLESAFLAAIMLIVLVCGAWLLSSHSYSRGYDAGLLATTDRVKTAEGELWTGINGLTAKQAEVWGVLMRENPDVLAAIPSPSACSRDDQQGGREYCWAKLWTGPAKPPTPSPPPEVSDRRKP
jgi:hypothetical protein